MNDLYLAAAAVGGGVALGGVLFLAFRRRAPRETFVPLEVLPDDEPAPQWVPDEPPFSMAAPVPVPVHASGPAPSAQAPTPRASAGAPAPRVQVHAANRPALILKGPRPTYDPDDPPELPESVIQTEWARRLVGPPSEGRMKGLCSGCGTHLSISTQRPVRIACPVCGRTRLLS